MTPHSLAEEDTILVDIIRFPSRVPQRQARGVEQETEE